MKSQDSIKTFLAPWGILLSDDQSDQVRRYLEVLLKWNRRVNLTGVLREDAILAEHFGESFFLAHRLSGGCRNLLDVGSGAGFPGLAAKILRPDLRVTLVESSAKKAVFLGEIVAALGWKGEAEVLRCRFEEAVCSLRPVFDALTMRGVSPSPILFKHGGEVLRPEGTLWIITSPAKAREIQERETGWDWEDDRGYMPVTGRLILMGHRGSTWNIGKASSLEER